MINANKKIQKLINQKIVDIVHRSSISVSQETYLVGGAVRDHLINRVRKNSDLDFVTLGCEMTLANEIKNKLNKNLKISRFKRFGTAHIIFNEINIEIVKARKESYHLSSRNPDVEPGTINDDLKRRDFTINAMAMDIHPHHFGKIYDPFRGKDDLDDNLLKTPLDPEQTFSDDPLRMMRAAYFASKLNFKLDLACRTAIKSQVKKIDIVSWERIRDELIKILSTSKPSIGLVIMQKTGLLKIVFPEIDVMYDMDQSPEWHHKDIFAHTLQVVDNAAKLTNKMEIRFAALVHDIAKPPTRRIDPKRGYTFHGHDAMGERMLHKVSKRLRLSNQLSNYLKKLTLLHLRPIALAKNGVTDSAVRRLMVSAGSEIDDLMTLCRADITTKNPKLVNRYLRNFDLVEDRMKVVLNKDSAKKFQSPVRGSEIMEIFNIKEGKKVGELKKSIEDAILDGVIRNTYEDAKQFLIEQKEK